jgi:hypothetical protein
MAMEFEPEPKLIEVFVAAPRSFEHRERLAGTDPLLKGGGTLTLIWNRPTYPGTSPT